jgi:hypothetical protein
VGSCIDDNVHIDGLAAVSDSRIKQILLKINRDNPLDLIDIHRKSNQECALIFVSLGTIYNDGLKLYSKIIQSFNFFDKEPITNDENCDLYNTQRRRYKLSELSIIVSVGTNNYDEFMRLIKSGALKIPDNMLIVEFAPQLEVLKRASLFITHCGMNSTNEGLLSAFFFIPEYFTHVGM